MTIPEILQNTVDKKPEDIAFSFKDKDGRWESIIWSEFYKKVQLISNSLLNFGATKGDVLVIMLKPSLEWELLHHAALALGVAVVGVEPDSSIDKIEYIIKNTKANIFAFDKNFKKQNYDIFSDSKLLIIDNNDKSDSNYNKSVLFSELENSLGDTSNSNFKQEVSDNDVAWIVLTSGTTGDPGLISYTHSQVLFAVDRTTQLFKEFKEEGSLVSWLPLSSLFQRMLNICAISSKSHLYFVPEPKLVINDLSVANPKIFIGVPRFYEKLHKNLILNIKGRNSIIKNILFFLLKGGHQKGTFGSIFRKINKYVFRVFRETFGNNLKYHISGSAPLKKEVLLDFNSIGILILEAYGLTECISPISANSTDSYRFGSVGKILPGNEFRIEQDGELIINSKGVGENYIKPALDKDNYLHTGDIVSIDEDGFLKITGRKKEIFKTSTGIKIIPKEVEQVLYNVTDIDNVIVVGENKPFLVGILSVSCEKNKIDFSLSEEETIINFLKNMTDELFEEVQSLPNKLQPAGFVITLNSFTVEGGELTSNMKLRRKFIENKYKDQTEMLYSEIADKSSKIHVEPVILNESIYLLKKQIR